MFNWEGRILDNKSIMAVKAALPFLDIPIGEIVDLEGLLRAVRCFCQKREQKLIDMLLSFFMMKRVMSMMSVMNGAQNSEQGMDGILELLKAQVPKEQQEMFDMMSMMMSMSEMNGGDFAAAEDSGEASEEMPGEMPDETSNLQGQDSSIPEIWRRIAENMDKENNDGRPE